MVCKMNNIYEKVAKDNNLNPKLVKSIGDSVFSHMKEKILSIDEGSIYLAHVGAFVLKSVKVEKQLKRYLSMRAYKNKKYPNAHINVPIGKKAKMLFDLYRNVIIPFKKYKRHLSERQVEFCKKKYEEYQKDSNNIA
jgi:hypothetical protein